MSRRIWPAVLVLASVTGLATVAVTVPAAAAWSLSGGGGAGGAAAVVGAGTTPTAVAGGTSVRVSWAAVTLSNGAAVQGYVITRVDTLNGSQGVVGAACSGIVTTTTCTESGVPSGTWAYAETPVLAGWSGPESALSASVTIP